MAVSAEELARELKAFDDRRALVQAMRRGLNRAAPPVRKAVKAYALEILPGRNGLAAWVAAARLVIKIGYAGRSAGVRIVGSRKSTRDRSDLNRIDQGRVRAPSWGRRKPGSWHTQAVTAGWFSTPVADDRGFRDTVDAEVDRALEVIRGGA